MANYQGSSNYVNLTHLPTPKQERVVNFDKLTGGLNLYAPDYELKRNESPDMENMLWKNGVLCSRNGQSYTCETPLLEYTETDTFTSVSDVKKYTLPSILAEGEDRYVRIESVTLDDVETDNWVYLGNASLLFWAPPPGGSHVVVTVVFADKSVQGHTCTSEPYWDVMFFHIGECIWASVPSGHMTMSLVCDLQTYYHGADAAKDVTHRGTFLKYGDDLYYKTRGVFLRIHYNGSGFDLSDVYTNAYTPILLINTDASSGAGDMYQPANFLSNKRTVWYNAGTVEGVETFTGDGTTTDFSITLPDFVYVTDVTIDGATSGNWTVSGTTLSFYVPPDNGEVIVVKAQCATTTYVLPETAASIESVVVDGNTLTPHTDYDPTQDMRAIEFVSAPPVRLPFENNTVRITYSITPSNADAYKTIMDCPYAIVYGGNQNICMVMGGSRFNPNAFFWNGNNVIMDPSYWPVQHYNFGGDTEEPITGFGRQQGNLIVFKSNSVGKVSMNFTTVDIGESETTARVYIEMDYTSINSRIGCDLPWSIQLVDNNLVFCNTKQGVHFLADSSAAYENNIICISTKVNGDSGRVGLLERIRKAEKVVSFDDDKRYWIIADNRVFCWDYELSPPKDPSWFYLTNIDAVSLFKDGDTIYHLGLNGRVTVFDHSFADYGQGMIRRYRFATEYFYSYDRMKTVTSAIFAFRTDTTLTAKITYITDYEKRDDLTEVYSKSWSLVPRDLTHRDLSVDSQFAHVARRRPGCRHIRHFAVVLTSTAIGADMPILSAQIFYKYEGRDRGNVRKRI